MRSSMLDWQVYAPSSGDYAMSGPMFIIIALFVVVLQLRERRIRLWSLIFMPAFMLLVTVSTITMELNSGLQNLAIIAFGFIIGLGAGALIGSRMEVKMDEKGNMILKGSVVAVILWVAILGLKFFGKSMIGDLGIMSFDVLTSALLAMTLGTMIARRVYVLQKYLAVKKQASATA